MAGAISALSPARAAGGSLTSQPPDCGLPLAVWSRTGRWRGSRLCSADGLRRALLDAFRIDTRTITRHDMQGDNENVELPFPASRAHRCRAHLLPAASHDHELDR
nr:hypothetical protein [Candidatus Glomeribacter gigasporarum]